MRTCFAELQQAAICAAITVRVVAVIATFVSFHDEIATTRIDANIGIGLNVAKLETWTIDVCVAGTNQHIAKAARANRRRRTHLSDFFQTLRIATIAAVQITVVATFVGGDEPIAATFGNALRRAEYCITGLKCSTIFIAIANALIDHRIAESAGACIGIRTSLQELDVTKWIATIARQCIPIVTTFIYFDDVVAASGGHTRIGNCLQITHVHRRTIDIRIASANVAIGIAKSTGANGVRHAILKKFF